LGSLEVQGPDGPVALGGVKQRAVLAVLLLDAGRVVTVDRLVATVWEEDPPPSARNTLQSYISHLRRRVGAALRSRAGGYQLDVDPETVDANRFERLLAEGRAALDAGDAHGAEGLLARALDLWRGTALADFEGWAFADPPRARLEELQLVARETAAAAALAMGRHGEAVGELEGLLRAHPLREHLRALLMTALYRSGRQADALAVHREGRELLADDLGIEPGAELQRLEHDILQQTPALAWTPPPAAPAPRLPAQLSSFVGRADDMAAIGGLLAGERLVTLTGPAGCGKTRLALHVAERLAADHPDGIWFADLAPVNDPALLPGTVAAVLGLAELPQRSPVETLAGHLHDRRALLVLDNCEHLVTAAADLTDSLLRRCPSLRVLATSREPLRVPGEVKWQVPSLAVPVEDEGPAVLAAESVRLFNARAAATRPGWTPSAADAGALARISTALDGIPLAIELAAARIGLLGVDGIAARLHDSLALLTHGSRTALPRQRTLRAAVDWSHDLLEPPERAVLRRLSVFAGDFGMEAAEAVCAGGDIAAGDVLELLAGLVDRSLVMAVEREGRRRYRLLETMRQYAARRLDQAGEGPALRDRHAAHHLALARRQAAALRGPGQRAALEELELEHDNLRVAVRWLGERGDSAGELALAGSLWRWCHLCGHYREGRAWLERALARPATPGETIEPALVATATHGAGVLAYLECDYPRASQLCRDAHERWAAIGDRCGVGAALNALGAIARERGDYGAAVARHDEAAALFRDLGDDADLAASLHAAGFALWLAGDPQRAARLCWEALGLFRRLGDEQRIASALVDLGAIAHYRGDPASAHPWLEEGLARSEALGFKEGVAWASNLLGLVLGREGATPQADALLRRSLGLHAALGDRWRAASVLEALAACLHDSGERTRAARLMGAADALRTAVGTPLPPCEAPEHQRVVCALVIELGPEAFGDAWTQGTYLSLKEAAAS